MALSPHAKVFAHLRAQNLPKAQVLLSKVCATETTVGVYLCVSSTGLVHAVMSETGSSNRTYCRRFAPDLSKDEQDPSAVECRACISNARYLAYLDDGPSLIEVQSANSWVSRTGTVHLVAENGDGGEPHSTVCSRPIFAVGLGRREAASVDCATCRQVTMPAYVAPQPASSNPLLDHPRFGTLSVYESSESAVTVATARWFSTPGVSRYSFAGRHLYGSTRAIVSSEQPICSMMDLAARADVELGLLT